jgi:hypothetical protein
MEDVLNLAGTSYRSRLIVGTGKYKDFQETKKAIEVSGAEIVTVAVRRVNITDPNKENLLDYLDPKKTYDSAQHRGLLHGGRCGSDLSTGARGWCRQNDQARSDR